MGQTKSLLTGLGVALVIGGGGGFALKPLAASGKTENASTTSAPQVVTPRFVVEDVAGNARALMPGDSWRRVRVGDELERPAVIVTEGIDSSVTMALKSGTRVLIRHDARVLLSAPGSALAVQLDNGLVVVYARGGQVPVHVPAVQAVLTGEVFGVWAKGDSLVTAVIDGEVSLHTPVVDSKYAKGREIKLSQRGPLPLVLAQQLEIEVERSERAGARYHLSGKTTPNAELFARKGGRFEAVELSSSGTFTVELDTKEPQLGDVVAYDAAGRRAEVNVPSETLDDVLASLAKGQPIERRTGATLPLPGAGEKAAAREEPAEVKGGEKAAKGEVVQPAQPKGETPETVAIPNPGNPKAAKEQEKKGKTEHIPRGSEPTPVSIDLPGMPKDKPAETGGKKGKKAEPAEKGAEKADKPAEDPNKPVEVQFE